MFSTNDNSETIRSRMPADKLWNKRRPLSIRVELCLRSEHRETRISAFETSPFSLNCTILPQLGAPKDKIIWSSHLGCPIDIVLLAEYTAIDGTVQALSQIIVTILSPGIGYSVRSWDCGLD